MRGCGLCGPWKRGFTSPPRATPSPGRNGKSHAFVVQASACDSRGRLGRRRWWEQPEGWTTNGGHLASLPTLWNARPLYGAREAAHSGSRRGQSANPCRPLPSDDWPPGQGFKDPCPIQPQLQTLLGTRQRVYLSTPIRLGRDGRSPSKPDLAQGPQLHVRAFSDKWFDVAQRCGKEAEALQVPWVRPFGRTPLPSGCPPDSSTH